MEAVDVSLERGQASIRLRPGNRITVAQLRQLVKSNGFNARGAAVTVVGELIQDASGPALSVTGTGVVLIVKPDSARAAAYQTLRDRLSAGPRAAVTLDGVVPERQTKEERDSLVLEAIDRKSPEGAR